MSSGIVVDNSVSIGWVYQQQLTPYAEAVLSQLGRMDFQVPAHWPLELANSLLLLERRKKMSREQRQGALGKIAQLLISVQQRPESLEETLQIADRFHLTSYDAAYLVCARRLDMPLATQDAALKKAASSLGCWFDTETL